MSRLFALLLLLSGCWHRPTKEGLRQAVGRALTGDLRNTDGDRIGVGRLLCQREDAQYVRGTPDGERVGDLPLPLPRVVLHLPGRPAEHGTASADIDGLAAGSTSSDTLTPPVTCRGTVTFDYRFGWIDNGVSSRWDCHIDFVSAAPAKNLNPYHDVAPQKVKQQLEQIQRQEDERNDRRLEEMK